MENTVRIRRATQADLPALVRLNGAVQELHARNEPAAFKLPSHDLAGNKELFQKLLNEPDHCVLVAERGQTVAGYLFAQEVKRDADWLRPAQWHFMLEHVAVYAEFQGQGIGSALIGEFFAQAKSRGIARAELAYWSFNVQAARFFRKHGLVPMHIRMGKTLL